MDDNDIENVSSSRLKLLWATPLGEGNSDLWALRRAVEDDRYIRIFRDISELIRNSERACEEAVKSGPQEYARIVAEYESDYIEELIGAAFLILQSKIRRVVNAAIQLAATMKADEHIETPSLIDRSRIKSIGGGYKDTDNSLISYVWALANYFKHRDDWTHDVWASEEELEDFPSKKRLQENEVKTRKIVQQAGIVEFSTGNMMTGLKFFDISPYSSCEKLARSIQQWADSVYEVGKAELRSAVASR